MEEKNLFAERKELFDNAIQIKHNKRTPLFSNFWTWKILDSDYTLSEALHNYDVMETVVSDFHNRYQFDAYMDLGTRNPMRVTDALGVGFHKIDEKNESIVVDDHRLMERDEYTQIRNNMPAFIWSKAFARYTPNLTIGQLNNAAMEFASFGEYTQRINTKFLTEFQTPLIPLVPALLPFEHFFNIYRGIKEVSIDLRKCKTELIEAMDVMYETVIAPSLKTTLASDTSSMFCDTICAFLGHSILSEKQFEEYYWRYLKKIVDEIMANNKTMFIFCESTMLRFVDFFKDIPKGTLMIHLEQDNIFEMRKLLPNICFMGGMTSDLLGNGTKQQCVDYAKKLIDDLGDGYVFSTNKMMSFRNDCKRENLIAVTEFVRNYRH
ncbi:MAG: uroporphyrinogen decarboxylase family protein [Anaerofustis sp.]